jgi:phage-related protein
VKQLGSNILNALKSLPSQALQAGKDLIQGLINGVKNMASRAVSSVKDLGRSLVSGIKSVLKIGSPSKVFTQIGAWTAEGFGIGYESTMDDVQSDMLSSMDGLTGNMTATVQANGISDPLAGSEVNTYNGGNISINVYGAEGQSIDALADKIAYKLEDLTRRKAAVFG